MIGTANSTGAIILQILFFVLVAAGVIISGFRQQRAARQRVSNLRGLAAQLRFDSFSAPQDEGFAMGWGFLNRLSQGSKRYAFNLLRGTYHERPLFVFDYHYQTSSGKSTQEHQLTMLMLVLKEIFPRVTIHPGGEKFLQKMASAFGADDDIQFESAEFSRTYSVRCQEKRFAYDVCNAQMIEYLMANPGLEIEIQGPVILLAFDPQLPVAQIEFNLQRLIEIWSRLPEYLFTQNT